MNLKNYIYITLISFLALCITSCSDESVSPSDQPGPAKYQVSLTVKLPSTQSGTRSVTTDEGGSSDNVVGGTQQENLVNRAFIYFCVEDEVKVALEANKYTAIDNGYKITADVNLNELTALAGTKPQIIVVANPVTIGNQNIAEVGPDKAKFTINDISANPIGDFGSAGKIMPMANAYIDNLSFDLSGISADQDPTEILDAITNIFEEKNNIYNLGSIDLERAVARIEIGDQPRPENKTLPTDYENVFQLGTNDIYLQLDHLQVFNVNTTSYLLRHTAEGDLTNANQAASLFGKENSYPANSDKYKWIAGADWTFDSAEGVGSFSKETSFLNRLNVSEDGYSILDSNEAVSTKGIISINELMTREASDGDGYRPMCYVTENVIPSIEMMDEDNLANYATGVAFTFVVLGTDNKPLEYSASKEKYPTDISNTSDSETKSITITPQSEGGKFQTIEPIDGKYYLTYYGFIKHHNPDSPSMAPMKYGVVRNNTYQLRARSISKLPDPQEPSSLYLSLEVKVLSWARHDITVSW